MKENFQMLNAECRIEKQRRRDFVIRHPSFGIRAFTIIELLAVITIIGVLSAFLFTVLKGIKQKQYVQNATAEMEQLETAIERYKAAEGFYPPDNQLSPGNPLINQLYFELLGTTNVATPPNSPSYQSLDDPGLPPISQANVTTIFGVNGFMNCNKPGASEDVRQAQNFLPGLKPTQITYFSNNNVEIKLLVTAVTPPGPPYCPLGPLAPGINPWRYNSSNPTNNPGAYDLWLQLPVRGTNNPNLALICNWNQRVQWNSPLP